MSIRSGLLPSQTINDFREIQIILEHEYSNSIVKNHSCPRVIDSVNLRMLVEKLKNEEISIIESHVVDNLEYSIVFSANEDETSKITVCFQEDQILKTKLTIVKKHEKIRLQSFWDVWMSNSSFRDQIMGSSDPNEEKWRLCNKYNYKIATTFMPIYAKTIYQYFGNPMFQQTDSNFELRLIYQPLVPFYPQRHILIHLVQNLKNLYPNPHEVTTLVGKYHPFQSFL